MTNNNEHVPSTQGCSACSPSTTSQSSFGYEDTAVSKKKTDENTVDENLTNSDTENASNQSAIDDVSKDDSKDEGNGIPPLHGCVPKV